jgi:hypothetical protein
MDLFHATIRKKCEMCKGIQAYPGTGNLFNIILLFMFGLVNCNIFHNDSPKPRQHDVDMMH